jgi:hypothetical protein
MAALGRFAGGARSGSNVLACKHAMRESTFVRLVIEVCDELHIEDCATGVSVAGDRRHANIEETIMNQPASLSATITTTEHSQSTQAERPIALWALVAVLVAIACTVLVLDGSLTADQRIALFMQSAVFP